jgi:putative copper resistance protein D
MAAVVGVGVLATLLAAAFTGAAAPLDLGDPGGFVRWGLPVAGTVSDLAAVTTLGLLGLSAFLVPERRDTTRRVAANRLAAVTATVWATAGGLVVLLSFADLAGLPLSDPDYLHQLFRFVLELEVTRVALISAGVAMVVAVGSALATRRAPTAWLALATLVAIVLAALTGHVGGSASHEDAVNSLGVHLLGVSVWVGGLIALVILRSRLGRDLGVTVARYSTLAGWAFAAVALSGIQQAWLRVGSISAFTGTAYGRVVLVKAAALVGLGVAGYYQRRNLSTRLTAAPSDGRAFARLAGGEVVVMALAVGLAVALSRSAPPVPDALPNPSRILALTMFPDPGPMTSADWVTAWRMDWLLLAVAVVAVGLYAAGVRRLRRRGDSWPWGRTVSWVCGWLVWVYATCGAPDIWGRVLFSVHMVMHMTIAMIVPILLVPGAPITLLLRALPARQDKTWGPREVFLHIVQSRALVVLANPVVASALFFLSLAAFYFSPLFSLGLTTHFGHFMMMLHFIVTGYLFVHVLIGTDPGPPRWPPLILLVVLFVTISFHAFFGIAILSEQSLLAGDVFTTIHQAWMPSPMSDQYVAGEIAWGIGEAPTLLLAILVARNWVRSDEHDTRRRDRQADRDGDAELVAYNDFLARAREAMREPR